MRAWPDIEVPRLPGVGAPPRVFDTATGRLATVGAEGRTGLYVCGITPYDATHLGHAATYLAFDILLRVARDANIPMRYVQNVTDVDDPLLERANLLGEDWRALAERETDLFRADMTALHIVPPDVYAGAVESIPLVLDMIRELEDRGATYDIEGDVYFAVGADEHFATVGRLDRHEMLALFAERGGDPDRPGKREALDCILWLHERPGEPSWDSPWGRGRPGWHIECAAIALHHLDGPIGVQGGGRDLIFPHHELSASHARVAREQPFADAYVHAGMVGLDGVKMSKSLGNLVLVSALREAGEDPMAIRLALLDRHYRADWSWSTAALEDARERLDLWRVASRHRRAGWVPEDPAVGLEVRTKIRDRLADDLDTPGALASVDAWAAHAMAAGVSEAEAGAVAAACDTLLGVAL